MALPLYTNPGMSKTKNPKDSIPLDPCNVFVKYLPSDLRDADLGELFGPFGLVLSSKIMLDPVSRQSLGFGFVRFSNASEAQQAIFSMDGHRLGAKRLLCKLANSARTKDGVPVLSEGKAPSDETPSVSEEPLSAPTSSPAHSSASSSESIPRIDSSGSSLSPRQTTSWHAKTPSTNLYIKNLVTTDSEDFLKAMFGPFGEIETVKIMTYKGTGVRRGVGFVRFKSLESAARAIEMMNGVKHHDSRLVVQYADDEAQKSKKRALASANTQPGNAEAGNPAPYVMLSRHASLESRSEFNTRRNNQLNASAPLPHFAPMWQSGHPYHQPHTPYAWAPAIYAPSSAVYDPQTAQWVLVYGGSRSSDPSFAPSAAASTTPKSAQSSPQTTTNPLAAGSSPTNSNLTPAPPFVTSLHHPYGYPIATPMYYPIDPAMVPPEVLSSLSLANLQIDDPPPPSISSSRVLAIPVASNKSSTPDPGTQ